MQHDTLRLAVETYWSNFDFWQVLGWLGSDWWFLGPGCSPTRLIIDDVTWTVLPFFNQRFHKKSFAYYQRDYHAILLLSWCPLYTKWSLSTSNPCSRIPLLFGTSTWSCAELQAQLDEDPAPGLIWAWQTTHFRLKKKEARKPTYPNTLKQTSFKLPQHLCRHRLIEAPQWEVFKRLPKLPLGSPRCSRPGSACLSSGNIKTLYTILHKMTNAEGRKDWPKATTAGSHPPCLLRWLKTHSVLELLFGCLDVIG